MTGTTAVGQPGGLAMVADPALLDGLLRLAAAAGRDLHRVFDPVQARRFWHVAPSVLLDADAAQQCVEARLPRRDRVVVAVRGEPPPEVWQAAVEVGAAHVVALPEAEAWLVDWLAEPVEVVQPGGGVLAVVGGRGGAGASVLASAVAVAAVRDGRSALLVDCDPLGGGLDLALGAEDLPGLRWPGIDIGAGRVPVEALHAALPAPALGRGAGGQLAVLACGRPITAGSGRAGGAAGPGRADDAGGAAPRGPSAEAVAAVIESGRRAGETVVCDLPRQPAAAALAALHAADLTVLVVPADVRAGAAAQQVAALLAEHAGPAGLVVRGPAPGGVRAADLAEALGLRLLAAMRPEPRLARTLESGHPPGCGRGPLADTARTLLAELGRVTGRGAS